MSDLAKIFTSIYAIRHWGLHEGTLSGYGSSKSWTRNVAEMLPDLMEELGVHTLLDAGCGDFNWMSGVKFRDVRLYACDVVQPVVRKARSRFGHLAKFFVRDITVGPLPQVDLILCRTVLFHLCFDNIIRAIQTMVASQPRWLLLTTHLNVPENVEKADGDFRRINLQMPPINLPLPRRVIVDGPTDDGKLALWNTEDLQSWMSER